MMIDFTQTHIQNVY